MPTSVRARPSRLTNVRVAAATAAIAVAVLALAGAAAAGETNPRITRDNDLFASASYTRYDGTQDARMLACSRLRTIQNEPTIAVDPHSTNVVVAGANDYCGGGGAGWPGYYRSVDGGTTWADSLTPGYPSDTSTAGLATPMQGTCSSAGDPTQSFDNDGRLYYGFICFNLGKPVNGGVYVATYDQDGAHYVRTVRVKNGTPSAPASGGGHFQDKDNLAVDQTGGSSSGNVYYAWAQYEGQSSNNAIFFSRSVDHGASFSKPMRITPGGDEEQYADVSVGPNGAVYVTYHAYPHGHTGDAIWLVKSTDGGQTFGPPSLVAPITPFSSTQFTGEPSGGAEADCGDSPPCPSGLTFARFDSFSAVAADATGVHVVWSARLPSGQAKIFARNSPDGVRWPTPATTLDSFPIGHQYWPDIASADGVITVVFYDSRVDAGYSVDLPPGDYPDGTNSGGAIDTYVARSTDGGIGWSETPVSSFSSNPNWEVFGSSAFFGDYIYVSAVPGAVNVAWTSSSDLGTCSYCAPDGFEVNLSDENIYGARIP